MHLPDPVRYAVPGFIALVLAEMAVASAKDRSRYEARDTLTSLLLGLGSTVAGALSGGAVFALATWVWHFRAFWIHTEAIDRMPRWFEGVMNTPSHHRAHHATNPRYLDTNYAGVFIVWDEMFGTFEPERRDDAPRYGLVHDLGSFNVLWAAFHEWAGIARDVWRARGLRAGLGYLVMPPGWSHDGSRDTSDSIKTRWRESES